MRKRKLNSRISADILVLCDWFVWVNRPGATESDRLPVCAIKTYAPSRFGCIWINHRSCSICPFDWVTIPSFSPQRARELGRRWRVRRRPMSWGTTFGDNNIINIYDQAKVYPTSDARVSICHQRYFSLLRAVIQKRNTTNSCLELFAETWMDAASKPSPCVGYCVVKPCHEALALVGSVCTGLVIK